jgi:hypothetical protein
MPTQQLGFIHHSGSLCLSRAFRLISIQIIAPLRWAVERLAERLAGFVMASCRGCDVRHAFWAAA